MRSAELLNRIADALGMDAAAFEAAGEAAWPDKADERAGELQGVVLLHRIMTAFLSLPTDKAKLRALHLVEAFAARTNDDALRQDDGADRGDGL